MAWPSNSDNLDARRASWMARIQVSGQVAGIEIIEDFARFSQRNDIFTRAFWDKTVKTAQTDGLFASYRKGDGFLQKDFALRNASWLISDVISNRNAASGKRDGFQAPI